MADICVAHKIVPAIFASFGALLTVVLISINIIIPFIIILAITFALEAVYPSDISKKSKF